MCQIQSQELCEGGQVFLQVVESLVPRGEDWTCLKSWPVHMIREQLSKPSLKIAPPHFRTRLRIATNRGSRAVRKRTRTRITPAACSLLFSHGGSIISRYSAVEDVAVLTQLRATWASRHVVSPPIASTIDPACWPLVIELPSAQ